jgi:hypothetical protein
MKKVICMVVWFGLMILVYRQPYSSTSAKVTIVLFAGVLLGVAIYAVQWSIHDYFQVWLPWQKSLKARGQSNGLE